MNRQQSSEPLEPFPHAARKRKAPVYSHLDFLKSAQKRGARLANIGDVRNPRIVGIDLAIRAELGEKIFPAWKARGQGDPAWCERDRL